MVEKLILEENPEHIEIEVLGEIEELLSDTTDTLQPFYGIYWQKPLN